MPAARSTSSSRSRPISSASAATSTCAAPHNSRSASSSSIRTGRIDDDDALRELCGAAQVLVAALAEEIGLLLLELVERAAGIQAFARDFQRHVEQQGQV